MAINGVTAVGDDQKWKAEMEREIERLREQIRILMENARNR